MLTRDDIARLAPRPSKPGEAQKNWDGYIAALTSPEGAALFQEYGIDTRLELCGVMANMAQETGDNGGFTCLWENLRFKSVAAIRKAWGTRSRPYSDAWIAANLLNNPEAVGEWAYGGRMGNGKGNGDGYKYRGWGPLQATGKTDHLRYIKGDYSYLNSVRVALAEWRDKGCGDHVNAGDFDAACILINGGRNGLAERRAYFAKAKKIWTSDPVWDASPDSEDGADTDVAETEAPVYSANPLPGPTARDRVETAKVLAGTSRKWFLITLAQWKGRLMAAGGALGLVSDDPVNAYRHGKELWLEFGLVGLVILGIIAWYIASKSKSLMVTDTLEGRYKPSGGGE